MRTLLLGFSVSLFLFASLTFSQNITNTLGNNGVFKIKDGSTDYLSLSQSTGNISLYRNLELGGIFNSTSTIGVITKGNVRFIHTYQAPLSSGYNIFIGQYSGNFTMSYLNTVNDASSNTAVGVFTLTNLTSGSHNSAFGYTALMLNSDGFGNSAFGFSSLLNNTTGSRNSAFGVSTLYANHTGCYNSGFGDQALLLNMTGNQNTAVGHVSLYSNVSGFQNTAVGDSALYYNTGNYNTAIGYNAGSNVTTGANLTLIGIDANPSSGSAFDEITLGNIYVQHLRCNVQTITSLSDVRDKKNIRDLNLGLDFLMTLKPRLFNWDKRDWYQDGKSDGSKMQQTPTAGFIAQELDTAQTNANAEWLNLVLKTNPDRLESTPGNLLPVIVKAIQEVNLKCEQLKTENDRLEEKVQFLEQELNLKNNNTSTVKFSNNY